MYDILVIIMSPPEAMHMLQLRQIQSSAAWLLLQTTELFSAVGQHLGARQLDAIGNASKQALCQWLVYVSDLPSQLHMTTGCLNFGLCRLM